MWACYLLYIECRSTQLFSVETRHGESLTLHIVQYTTGLHHLPEPGGMLDQPVRMMRFFTHFMEGDNQAAFKQLS